MTIKSLSKRSSSKFFFFDIKCLKPKKTHFRNRKRRTNTQKKIKLQHQKIQENIRNKRPDIDIKEHEIQKFILIFQELIKQIKLNQDLQSNIKEEEDSTDRIKDILTSTGEEL